METLTILVVEDEAVVREYIRGTLETLGYRVPSTVSNGRDAVAQAEKFRPDVVLMDIRLKGEIDGIEAASQIGTAFGIPVVYLTSYADEETLNRAKVTNPAGYIMKPFNEQELRATIEIAVYKHHMETEAKASLLQELQQTSQRISGLLEHGGLASQKLPDALENVSAEQTFTVKDAAAYLDISERTILRMIKEHLFPEPSVTISLGGNRQLRRWSQRDLDIVKPNLRGKGRPKQS